MEMQKRNYRAVNLTYALRNWWMPLKRIKLMGLLIILGTAKESVRVLYVDKFFSHMNPMAFFAGIGNHALQRSC